MRGVAGTEEEQCEEGGRRRFEHLNNELVDETTTQLAYTNVEDYVNSLTATEVNEDSVAVNDEYVNGFNSDGS